MDKYFGSLSFYTLYILLYSFDESSTSCSEALIAHKNDTVLTSSCDDCNASFSRMDSDGCWNPASSNAWLAADLGKYHDITFVYVLWQCGMGNCPQDVTIKFDNENERTIVVNPNLTSYVTGKFIGRLVQLYIKQHKFCIKWEIYGCLTDGRPTTGESTVQGASTVVAVVVVVVCLVAFSIVFAVIYLRSRKKKKSTGQHEEPSDTYDTMDTEDITTQLENSVGGAKGADYDYIDGSKMTDIINDGRAAIKGQSSSSVAVSSNQVIYSLPQKLKQSKSKKVENIDEDCVYRPYEEAIPRNFQCMPIYQHLEKTGDEPQPNNKCAPFHAIDTTECIMDRGKSNTTDRLERNHEGAGYNQMDKTQIDDIVMVENDAYN